MANVDDDDLEDFDGADTPAFTGLKLNDAQAQNEADDEPAVKDLKAKIAADSKNASLHAQLGKLYLDLGADEEAAAAYDAAIALDGNNAAFYHGKAQAHLSASDSHGAEELLLKAHGLDPNNADILHDLGVAFRQEDHHQKALEYFKAAVAKAPKHARALLAVANYAHHDQKTDEAIDLFKQVIAADPSCTSAFYTAGQMLQTRNQGDDMKLAAEYFAKAVALDSTDPQHHAKLLQAYDHLGLIEQFEKTRADFLQAFTKGQLNPNFLLVGRYNCAQFEVDDKFVMVFDHFKLLGAEPARFAFIVYNKGHIREDLALYRISLIVKGNTYYLDSFDNTTRKHYIDFAAEPTYKELKENVVNIIKGTLAPKSTAPFSL